MPERVPRRPWYRQPVWPAILTMLSVTACAMVSWAVDVDISDVTPDSAGWWIFQGSRRKIMRRVGLGATALMVGIPLVVALVNAERLRRTKGKLAVLLNESHLTVLALAQPMNAHIARLAELRDGDERGQAHLMGQAAATALGQLSNLFKGQASSLRLCFWEVDGTRSPRNLVPKIPGGDGRLPNCQFSENDGGIGKRFFHALDHRDPIDLNDDNRADHPAGWYPDRNHRSFVAVPVATTETLYGMITLNTGSEQAFSREQDLACIQMVADQYAAFLSVCARLDRKAHGGR